MKASESQQNPVINEQPCIQDMVIADIEARKLVGIERYGTVLQPFNGRSALMDLYQELLDACNYIKQELVERTALEEKAFKAGYYYDWHRRATSYCFDPIVKLGDPDAAFKAWQKLEERDE